jgi:hypothetical protein
MDQNFNGIRTGGRMSPPYVPGQSLAWLTAETEGIRVHRAVVQAIEPAEDGVGWKVTTDWGVATVDDEGVTGRVVPIDDEIARELYVHGGDYLVRPTYIDLPRDLERIRAHDEGTSLDQDQSLDLDDGYGLD